jgi:hypothetical protein
METVTTDNRGRSGKLVEHLPARSIHIRMSRSRLILLLACTAAGACAIVRAPTTHPPSASEAARFAAISRAQVWTRTNIRTMNVRMGPGGPGSFAPGATVPCTYVDKDLKGKSPKFLCRVGRRDEVMVKFGRTNGEVFGEVLATRLLWALGFGADRMYPVKVLCRGCPPELEAGPRAGPSVRVDLAAIERRASAPELKFDDDKEGWSWDELDWANPEYGGAPRAHRDALKLLAVFLQHGDSKAEQQRIVCRDPRSVGVPESCRRPFLMISDLGLTFGRSNRLNANDEGSVNLREWKRASIWKDDTGCRASLGKSFTGTLANPVISEEGRRFLAGLLVQLSAAQLRDLFSIARVTRRELSNDEDAALGTIDEWVEAFRAKRQEIVERHCA